MDVQQASYDIRGRDIDTIFATQFTSDRCIDALTRAQLRFDSAFPGWALYRRLVTGDPLLDRTLEAYAIGMARMVAKARKVNGRAVVPAGTRGAWIAQAGRDALDFALFGKYHESANRRSAQLGIDDETYSRVRNAVAAGVWLGAESFANEARFQYSRGSNSGGLH